MRSTGPVSLIAFGTLVVQASAQQPCQPVDRDGATTLFIGHSFFVPISSFFDSLAVANGYPYHRGYDAVFSGGDSGTPEMLYENSDGSRDAVLARLTSDVEILGMTVGSPELSDEEDFATWIDIAIDVNPEIRIFIGVPWTPSAFTMPPALYGVVVEATDDTVYETVRALRSRYPGTQIDMVNYGKAVSELYAMFESGDLPDVDCLYPPECQPEDVPLFTDPGLGHAGPLIKEVSAIVWMNALYGAQVDSLQYTDYEADVEGVIATTLAYNCQFATVLCAADVNNDGILTGADFNAWLAAFSAGLPVADQNQDGVLNGADFNAWLAAFANGSSDPSCN